MDVTLTAELGRPTGSRPSRRIRAEGRVPGVVYGLGRDPVPVTVPWSELRVALTTEAGLNALITLDVGGSQDLTIVKELQRDPVRRTVTHVDFIRIDPDAFIEVEVPVVLTGEAEQLARDGGLVDQLVHQLIIKAKPGRIPNELTVDITGLTITDPVRVGDIGLPEGVTTDIDLEEPVAAGYVPRVEAEVAVGEGEEGVEGEGVEGEAAEAPAEGEGESAGDGGGE